MPDKAYLFLGDSITDAGHLWEEDPRMLGDGYVRKISEDPALTGARIVNRGQDGFTSANLLRLVKMQRDLSSFDVITVLIGVNDLNVAYTADPDWIGDVFYSSMEEIFSVIRENFDGKLVIVEPFIFTVVAEHAHQIPDLKKETTFLKGMATKYNGLYIPTQEMFDTACEAAGSAWKITVDGLHLTDEGNRLLGERWLEYVMR